MRRVECARRIQVVMLPKIKRAREQREKRRIIKKFGPGLATLKYLISTHKYSEVLSVDLSNPENHPEPEPDEAGPPPPEPEPEPEPEGEPEEGGAPPAISLLPLARDDPAYRPPVAVPGGLRLPLRAFRTFVQGSRLACRNRLWVLMLNTCYQASNLVEEYFQVSLQEPAPSLFIPRRAAPSSLRLHSCDTNLPPPPAMTWRSAGRLCGTLPRHLHEAPMGQHSPGNQASQRGREATSQSPRSMADAQSHE